MAGIGWKLERMLERDSLGSAMGAILTGVAVTSGPWLLTTAVLVLMRASAVSAGIIGVGETERVITVVYAVAIVLSAPVDIVLSRYAADRVYEGRRDRIAAPLRAVLSTCLVVFLLVGSAAMWLLGAPLALAVPGAALCMVVGAQWLLLSAAGGLSSPGIILRAFALGTPVSVLTALALARYGGLGAPGYLYGFGAGQLVTLGLLLWGTLRALPAEEQDSARIAPAFREYWLLAAAALAFHAGIWIDKLVVRVLDGASAASTYSALAAVAWLSVVPACAYLFICIETQFERRFSRFYQAVHTGASLADLERLARELKLEVGRVLRGTAAVQAGVTLICLLAAPAVAHRMGAPGDGDLQTLNWLIIGAALQLLALSATLLLHYFDFRTEAFAAAATQLTANGVLTWLVATRGGVPGVGYAGACALACLVAITLLLRRMNGLLVRTFQSQPYSSEG